MKFKSKQEIYDYVGEFLIKQAKRSYDKESGKCLYRGPNELKCAVGCIISDKYFKKSMDDNLMPVNSIILNFELPKYFKNFKYFLEELQNFHDDENNWNKKGLKINKLIEFGKNNNLDTSKFKQYGIVA